MPREQWVLSQTPAEWRDIVKTMAMHRGYLCKSYCDSLHAGGLTLNLNFE